MTRLVPEIVVEFHATQIVLPTADNLKVFIEMQEPPWGFPTRIAKHRNDDVGAEAMNGMWRREIGFRFDLVALNDAMQSGISGVRGAIYDVKIRASHARHDQIAAFLAGIMVTGRTRIPSHVVQLIADAGHFESTDHLRISGALGVCVDGGEIIRLLNTGTNVERHRV